MDYTGSDLFGVKNAPPEYREAQALAREARAYFDLRPYPWFCFADWKNEDRGPLPQCLPFVRTAVMKSARWLFGRGVSLSLPDNPDLELLIRESWEANRMHARLVSASEQASIDGAVCLKFSYDEDSSPRLRIQILSAIDHVRLVRDPHDAERVIMARIQYPAWDALSDTWKWHREEWTDDSYAVYAPVEDKKGNMVYGNSNPYVSRFADPDNGLLWGDPSISANPFGVIPVVQIKNVETENPSGIGDWWGLFRVVDRICLTAHLMDKSNQLSGDPIKAVIDAHSDTDDLEQGLGPGDMVSLKSDEGIDGSTKKASVELLESQGYLRPAMMEYARWLNQQLEECVGTSSVRPEEITNKGNLTQGVLRQLYAPLIERTEAKRLSWQDGLCEFIEKVAIGLANLGVSEARSVDLGDYRTYDVNIAWPEYFEPTPDEAIQQVQLAKATEDAGYTTHARALRQVAQAQGVTDLATLEEELEEENDGRNDQEDLEATATTEGSAGADLTGDGGDDDSESSTAID